MQLTSIKIEAKIMIVSRLMIIDASQRTRSIAKVHLISAATVPREEMKK